MVKDPAKKFILRKLVIKAGKDQPVETEAFSDTLTQKDVGLQSKISDDVGSIISPDLSSPVQVADNAISKNSNKLRAVKSLYIHHLHK